MNQHAFIIKYTNFYYKKRYYKNKFGPDLENDMQPPPPPPQNLLGRRADNLFLAKLFLCGNISYKLNYEMH